MQQLKHIIFQDLLNEPRMLSSVWSIQGYKPQKFTLVTFGEY